MLGKSIYHLRGAGRSAIRLSSVHRPSSRVLRSCYPSMTSVPARTFSSSVQGPYSSLQVYRKVQVEGRGRRYLSSGSSGPQPLGNIFQNAQQPQQSFLEQFTVNLTQQAQQDELDPIIGRHEEIRRCLQILARRSKNNPIVIGEAGVGKTAIAEGLAQRIASGQVPESMKDKQVLRLDVTSLISGAMYRGQFEERLQGVIREVQAQDGKIILFIDEIHTVVGAGGTGGGGGGGGNMDMSNMLKPALARGELQLLGATTLEEYRILERDAALARRFQSVFISEPNVEDTLTILRGLKTQYELHHSGLRIQDEALVAAATLSDRYLSDRKQPDKSIDLIDEACSRLRLQQESKPEILWKLERDLLTRQIELSAINTDLENNTADNKTLARKQTVEEQVNDLQQRVNTLVKRWEEEKEELSKTKTLKEDLERARLEMEKARRDNNHAKASELLYGTIPKLERELELASDKETATTTTKKKMLEDAVTADAIASLIAHHTGIPVSRLTGSESKKLLHIEEELRKRVIGQDHALEAVSNAVRLARTRLQANDRTLGNFMFLGPTGVGKTELCKALAEYLFDNEKAMTRIDMSEYSERHTISKLIGAPPGYVGYEDGSGVLTESVRRRPYQVILLDEFEKAHKEVWNVLLQLLDEGHLTDSRGRKVDFRNCIIVMTSNLGAHVLSDLPGHYLGTEPTVQESIMEVVRHTLSPELLNRIDETVIFNRLQRENMNTIAQIGISDIATRLEEGQNMKLDVSSTAMEVLSEKGFDVRYGARPLKRTLAREVLNPLSRLVLEGAVLDGDVVQVRSRGEAQRNDQNYPFGWISSNPSSEDKNDVVIIRNHDPTDAVVALDDDEMDQDGDMKSWGYDRTGTEQSE